MYFIEIQRDKWKENRAVIRLQNERKRLNEMANFGRIPLEVASFRVRQINKEIESIYQNDNAS